MTALIILTAIAAFIVLPLLVIGLGILGSLFLSDYDPHD
jgi:hypothetical protein